MSQIIIYHFENRCTYLERGQTYSEEYVPSKKEDETGYRWWSWKRTQLRIQSVEILSVVGDIGQSRWWLLKSIQLEQSC